jgi:hypothetical protein
MSTALVRRPTPVRHSGAIQPLLPAGVSMPGRGCDADDEAVDETADEAEDEDEEDDDEVESGAGQWPKLDAPPKLDCCDESFLPKPMSAIFAVCVAESSRFCGLTSACSMRTASEKRKNDGRGKYTKIE